MDIQYFVLNVSEMDGKAPNEIQILPLGNHTDGRGLKFHVGPDQIQSILSNFKKRTNDLVIDYEHQTTQPGAIAPASGWIKSLEDRGEDGLWASVEWTERGKQFIESKEYRYLSPVLFARKRNDEGMILPERLHSAALTNDPAIDGMVPLINNGLNPNQEEIAMKEILLQMKKMLGLKEEASDQQVIEALTLLKNKADKPEITNVLTQEVIDALGIQDVLEVLELKAGATVSEVKATVLALKQGADAVQNLKIENLEKKLASMKAESLVNSAMAEGKITAAQKEWAIEYAASDPEGFGVYVAKASQVVPVKSAPKGPEENEEQVDENALAIAGQFGNSKEDLEKFGGLKQAV